MSSWRQRLKWTVYAILLLDFVIYFIQDVESAHYTLNARSSLLDYGSAYVTSIDLAAWFTLLILFELETYVLGDRTWKGATKWTVRGVRLLCAVAILHTSFSYDITLNEFQHPRALPAAADVCAYREAGWSFLRNREYIDLDAVNCSQIGQGPEFFAIGDDDVLTDRAGLREGLILAWTDLVESIAWLLIILTTETVVRLKRGVAAHSAEWFKAGLYLLILSIALYWGIKQQYLYLWDELIWVGGFLLIDWNILEWWRKRQRPRLMQLA